MAHASEYRREAIHAKHMRVTLAANRYRSGLTITIERTLEDAAIFRRNDHRFFGDPVDARKGDGRYPYWLLLNA